MTWKEAKAFAQGVCQWMANEDPERYLLNMSKKLRKGKIFLDYLRNDRMATAVAVLSPRAREGATVSMPLTWAQVRGDLDPKRYTVRTVPALLARTKAWDGYDEAASSIKAAIKKLGDESDHGEARLPRIASLPRPSKTRCLPGIEKPDEWQGARPRHLAMHHKCASRLRRTPQHLKRDSRVVPSDSRISRMTMMRPRPPPP